LLIITWIIINYYFLSKIACPTCYLFSSSRFGFLIDVVCFFSVIFAPSLLFLFLFFSFLLLSSSLFCFLFYLIITREMILPLELQHCSPLMTFVFCFEIIFGIGDYFTEALRNNWTQLARWNRNKNHVSSCMKLLIFSGLSANEIYIVFVCV